MEPMERIRYLTDPGSFVEFSENLTSLNPIDLIGYEEKLSEAETKAQMKDAVITGMCAIEGRKLILGLMSFTFMGGSMGSVVGEKVCRALLRGAETGIPVAIYTTSGGARMQEGIFSLCRWRRPPARPRNLTKPGFPFLLFFVILRLEGLPRLLRCWGM
jgi:acetyl-CoA carboxylase carboxyl transferase subunit beta